MGGPACFNGFCADTPHGTGTDGTPGGLHRAGHDELIHDAVPNPGLAAGFRMVFYQQPAPRRIHSTCSPGWPDRCLGTNACRPVAISTARLVITPPE